MSTITFAGNLAADPELRFTPNGRQVVRFTLIENRRRPTPDGLGWEDAEPNVHRVQAWGSFAENVVESCGKGDRLHVTGTIITDRWTDKESGEQRTAPYVKAEEVSFTLRYHTVQATKANRNPSPEPHTESPTEQAGDPELVNGHTN